MAKKRVKSIIEGFVALFVLVLLLGIAFLMVFGEKLLAAGIIEAIFGVDIPTWVAILLL